ncbi:uncharacterized protein BDZ99DRAFT_546606, partial [Mytilinidion resinicola]
FREHNFPIFQPILSSFLHFSTSLTLHTKSTKLLQHQNVFLRILYTNQAQNGSQQPEARRWYLPALRFLPRSNRRRAPSSVRRVRAQPPAGLGGGGAKGRLPCRNSATRGARSSASRRRANGPSALDGCRMGRKATQTRAIRPIRREARYLPRVPQPVGCVLRGR